VYVLNLGKSLNRKIFADIVITPELKERFNAFAITRPQFIGGWLLNPVVAGCTWPACQYLFITVWLITTSDHIGSHLSKS